MLKEVMRTRHFAKILSYKFFKQLASLPFVRKIVLFGSRASGTNTERSDIDLAIECPSATPVDWHIVMQIIENADTLLKIDCVRLDKVQSKRFKNAILEEQVILFERSNT
jgi:predicted nucleotidyltransferase